jgi:type IV secretion system protein VirB4
LPKGERGFSDYLVYSHMAAPGVLALKNGSFVVGYLYEGPDMESASVEEIEHLHAMVNSATRRLGNGWMVHFESVRKPADAYPTNHFTEPVNRLIDLERSAQHKVEGAHFETMHFMFFTYLPPAIDKNGVYRKIADFLSEGHSGNADDDRTVEYMENTIADVLDVLGQGVKMKRLGFVPEQRENGGYETDCGYDELLTVLNYLTNGRWHPIKTTPCNTAYIDVMLARDVWLGSPKAPMTLDRKFLGLVSVIEYPLETYPGILRQLAMLPYEIRWSNRYIFSDFRKAQSMLDSQRKKWAQKVRSFISQIMQNDRAPVNQDAVHMVSDIDNASEELTAGWVGYGKHTSVVVVRADTPEAAEHITREVVKVFERNGFPARIEGINGMEAFIGSLPGHGHENVRKALINTLNLAHIVPLTNEWAGEQYNPSPEISKHYLAEGIAAAAPALIQATSAGSTPFRLNIHVSDLGHTLVLGPSGSGKSTLLALIVSQFERYKNARIFVFDKGYSMYPLCMALNDSVHYDLGSDANANTKNLSFCPLGEIDTVTDQGSAAEWLESMLILQGGEMTPARRTAISDALKILASSTASRAEEVEVETEEQVTENLTIPGRTITDFLATLQDEELREIFSYYSLGHAGEMLDGMNDEIRYAKTTVFELEHLFNMDKKIVVPVFLHIFKQIEKRILSGYSEGQGKKSGCPSLIVIDEAWLALSNPIFATKIKEWLKVLRKNNCAVILATQSLNDIVNSPIMDAVLDSCETRILLPNPNALSDSMKDLYMKHLALSEHQVNLIAQAEKKREYYYACETTHSHRLFSLALGPVALAFTGASGKEDLAEVRKLVAEHGNKWPEKWLEQRKLRDWAKTWETLHEEKRDS